MNGQDDEILYSDAMSEEGCSLDAMVGFLAGNIKALKTVLKPNVLIRLDNNVAVDFLAVVENVDGSYAVLNERHGDSMVKGLGKVSEICDRERKVLSVFKLELMGKYLFSTKLNYEECSLNAKFGLLEGFFSGLTTFLIEKRPTLFDEIDIKLVKMKVKYLSELYAALKEKHGDETVKGFGKVFEICDDRKIILDRFEAESVRDNTN